MFLDRKPKCSFCDEVLDDNFYWWWPDERGKSGKLVHTKCAVTAEDTISRVKSGLDKLREKLANRLNKFEE